MIAEALTLFDELPLPVAPSATTVRCIDHRGPECNRPEATHRIVIAVDLMHPRWWHNGLRDDGGLRGYGGGRVRLYGVGAGGCGACVAEWDEDPEPHPDDRRYGIVTHFVPLPVGATA